MKLSLLGVGLLMLSAACTGSAVDSGDPNLEGPDTAEDVAALTSSRVSIRLPLLDFDGKPLSKHNAALRAAGLGTFPDSVEIAGGASGAHLPGADKGWHDADALTSKAFDKLHLEIEMKTQAEPFEFKTNDPATTICYKGNAKLVVELLTSLTDGAISEQLSVHGWRFRQVKVLSDGIEEEGEATFPAVWKNWRGQGDAILTITSSSDGGEETNVSIIPKCS